MKYILILTMFLFACQEEPVEKIAPPINIEIGQELNEGIVFYIFNENDPEYIDGEQHGLIVSEVLGQFSWGCTNIPVDQFTTEGTHNTQLIISNCGINNAAGQCDALGWWLPSFEEWELLIDSGVISPTSDYYWTSSKHSYPDAYCIRESDGLIINEPVAMSLNVRGIKQF